MIRIIIEAFFITLFVLGVYLTGVLVGNGTIELFLSPQNQINLTDNSTNNINLEFGESINETDISEITKLANQLDPKYLSFVKRVFFSRNKTELGFDNGVCTKNYGENGCGGYYDGGEIFIFWKGTRGTKKVLCHELLHGYIHSVSNKAHKTDKGWVYPDDPKHTVIEDLAGKGVCYK